MHIEKALAQYALQLRADGRSKHTIAQYERHIRLLARWSGRTERSPEVEDLGHVDIAEFLVSDDATLRPDGIPKRATSMNGLRSSIRVFFGHLHAAELIPRNPAVLVRRARCSPAVPRGLDEKEQRRLMKTLAKGTGEAAERDHMLFELLLRTGLRIGSALALEVPDVDLPGAVLEIRQAKNDAPTIAFLPPAIVVHLRSYLAGRTSGFLFPGQNGGPLSQRHASRRLAIWCGCAGIQVVGPHALRHCFGTAVYQRSGDLLITKEALGHRSVASTLVYARGDPGRLREVIEGAVADVGARPV